MDITASFDPLEEILKDDSNPIVIVIADEKSIRPYFGASLDKKEEYNVIFITNNGDKIHLRIDRENSMDSLKRDFLLKVWHTELYDREDENIFTYNQKKLEFNAETKIKDFFGNNSDIEIEVKTLIIFYQQFHSKNIIFFLRVVMVLMQRLKLTIKIQWKIC